MFSLRNLLTTAVVVLLGTTSVHAQYLPIKGVHTGIDSVSGARPARLNIETLATSGAQWDLFIQALAMMQADNQSHLTSYYQVAGIHGRPYVAWNNVHSPSGPSGDQSTGYCTHNSILFPSWHRPYMALYEQTIAGYAQTIATQYVGSQKATYQNAANVLRIPYWDWASSPSLPTIVQQPNVTINTANGSQSVINPLFTYKFHPLSTTDFPTSDGTVATWKSTVRDPDANGIDQVAAINSAMNNVGYAGYIYSLFSKAITYPVFATTFNSGSSLEAIHGAVHNIVGGANGEMTVLAYSGFDPIFWLHHANVDRIFALWQSVYPDQYVTTQKGGSSTFTMAYNTVENVNTPLTPFSSDGSAMYTSTTARAMKTFGYTYPEINDWNQTAAQLNISVSTQVNALYNNGGSSARRLRHRASQNRTTTEWFIGTAVDRYFAGTSFNVYLFLGPPPSDPKTYAAAENLAGLSAIFAPIKTPGTMPVSLNYDEISLKDGLEKAGVDEADTEQFLTKNLNWVVVMANGTVIPNDCISSLKIWVQKEPVTPASDDCSFPTYGVPQVRPDITRGKAGSKF